MREGRQGQFRGRGPLPKIIDVHEKSKLEKSVIWMPGVADGRMSRS